jgi:hypothetical protein
MQQILKINSMGLRRGTDGITNYLELRLEMETANEFIGRLTLKEADAAKMYLKINDGIIIEIRSSNYLVTPEEAERTKKQDDQLPFKLLCKCRRKGDTDDSRTFCA